MSRLLQGTQVGSLNMTHILSGTPLEPMVVLETHFAKLVILTNRGATQWTKPVPVTSSTLERDDE